VQQETQSVAFDPVS